jgi:glycine amidinotransferase
MSDSPVNAFTSWQPLEEVIVGRCYTPDYFDFINDAQVKDQLGRIMAETEEDLDNLQKTIETYGATVRRPVLKVSQDDFAQAQLSGDGAPLPPLTPRDWQISLGDKLLRVLAMQELDEVCADYEQQGATVINPHGPTGFDENCILNGGSASCIVRVGKDVFFDNSEFLTEAQAKWIQQNVLNDRDYRFHEARTEGHGDAVFAILKPGVILSTYHADDLNLESEFPGWDFLRLNDPSIVAAQNMGRIKEVNRPDEAWYYTGGTPSDKMRSYVNNYLEHWLGYINETVFDVNCLVLDEQNVIFSAENEKVFKFCEKHGINPIVSPLRHQYFWDGGISCCTQDIRRRGGLEDYFS